MRYLTSLIDYLSSQLLPSRCFICHDYCADTEPLCQECRQNLPFLAKSCELCAATLEVATDTRCGACLIRPPAYEQLIAGFAYALPINSFIIQLKFHRQLSYAHLLGRLFSKILQTHYVNCPLPEAIVPVPLHRERLKERGFNQAMEIAKPIATALKLPILHRLVERNKPTTPQSQLPKQARKRNMAQAFTVKKATPMKHIALLDDVMTTGETIQALSRQLKQAGIETIHVWCVAKRMLDYEG